MSAMLQHLSRFIPDWQHYPWLYVLLAVCAGYMTGRFRARHAGSFQNRGEALLARAVQAQFGPPDFHLMNHVTLQMEDGTTQVDHILVSRFGVFVIETKDFKGWIFGNEQHASWTQVLFNGKFRFQNPIRQNFRHVDAVRKLLDFLPPDAIKSVVVFTGTAEFKTEVPGGVFSSVSSFIEHLHEQATEVMSVNRVQFSVGRLETTRLAVSGQTDVEHVESLARRHGGPL